VPLRTEAASRAPLIPDLLVELAAGREPTAGAVDQRTVALAHEHRLTGLLWSWARDHVADDALRSQLAQRDLSVQGHLVRVWDVLDECVTRLAAEGIEVATIKGVTTEARWYRRRGERPCSDVDLLLAPDQLDRAADAVRILQPDHPWVDLVGPLAASGRVQAVTTRVGGLEVDLHLDLLKLGIRTRQSAQVWASTTSFSRPDGGAVKVLDATTALVHAIVHLNKDRFQRLLGYADVARIAGSGDVDWDRLARFADGEGISVPVSCTLAVVLEELSLPWPTELERATGPRAWAWRRLWPPHIRLLGAEGRLRYRRRQDFLPLLARGRTGEGLVWWCRDVWPAPAVVAARYSDVRGPYLWKLFRGRARARASTRATRHEVLARRTLDEESRDAN
jgi:hypothetical protein